MSKSIDMINGSLWKSTLKFTVPIVLTLLLTQLFSVTDMIVVGQLCGSECVAAIGATGSLIALIVNFFLGISSGAGIVVAQLYGAGNNKGLVKAVHTAIPTAFLSGVLLTVVGLYAARPMLIYMGTPKEILSLSELYLKIYFLGIILRMIYVFSAAVLRAVGDSNSPLIYLTIGGVLNVGFNIFFVKVFNMSVDGVAWGTIISEGVSGILCLITLMRRSDAVKFEIKKSISEFDFKLLKKILVIGVPAGIQSSIFSIANVLLQSSVNSLGATVVAGNAAAASLGTFTYHCSNATSQTASNFMGQNYGARKFDRIKKLRRVCLCWMLIGTLAFGIFTRIFAVPLLGLYITDNPEALRIGIIRLEMVTIPYVLSGFMDIYTGLLRGLGKAVSSMIICITCICGIRLLWILTVWKYVPYFHTIRWLYAIYPVSWIVIIIVDTLFYRHVLKEKIQEDKFRQSQAQGSDKLYQAEKENG